MRSPKQFAVAFLILAPLAHADDRINASTAAGATAMGFGGMDFLIQREEYKKLNAEYRVKSSAANKEVNAANAELDAVKKRLAPGKYETFLKARELWIREFGNGSYSEDALEKNLRTAMSDLDKEVNKHPDYVKAQERVKAAQAHSASIESRINTIGNDYVKGKRWGKPYHLSEKVSNALMKTGRGAAIGIAGTAAFIYGVTRPKSTGAVTPPTVPEGMVPVYDYPPGTDSLPGGQPEPTVGYSPVDPQPLDHDGQHEESASAEIQ